MFASNTAAVIVAANQGKTFFRSLVIQSCNKYYPSELISTVSGVLWRCGFNIDALTQLYDISEAVGCVGLIYCKY